MSDYIFELINKETERQNNGIELIASENYPSKNVLNACGSILMDKYAEGYPDKRYYGGCEFIDKLEKDGTIKKVKVDFNKLHCNTCERNGHL